MSELSDDRPESVSAPPSADGAPSWVGVGALVWAAVASIVEHRPTLVVVFGLSSVVLLQVTMVSAAGRAAVRRLVSVGVVVWPLIVVAAAGGSVMLVRAGHAVFVPSLAVAGVSVLVSAVRRFGVDRLRPTRVTAERFGRALLATALIGAGLYGVAWWVDRREDSRVIVAGVKGMNPLDAAALQNQPDAEETSFELGEITTNDPYTPFTGSSLLDYTGKFVNVHNRVRTSYEPAIPAGVDPIDVWFFGASTVFGFALQRDLHTISSEFARDAEQAGIPVRVRNYGTTGVTNYSETVLLSLLTTGGERPDLVVFYDGMNDMSLQLLDRFGDASPPGEPGELGAYRIRDVVAESKGVASQAPSRIVPQDRQERPSARELVDDIVSTYGQGVDLSKALAAWYGFEVVHFWQPDIFTKQPLVPGEKALLEPLALDAFRYETMAALSRRIRSSLPPGVEDISGALNGTEGPVLTDIVHTNEVGAAAVAAAIFERVRPELAALAADR